MNNNKPLQRNTCPHCTAIIYNGGLPGDKPTPLSMLCSVHAAAPELYDALRAIMFNIDGGWPIDSDVINPARAAIAKAEGR